MPVDPNVLHHSLIEKCPFCDDREKVVAAASRRRDTEGRNRPRPTLPPPPPVRPASSPTIEVEALWKVVAAARALSDAVERFRVPFNHAEDCDARHNGECYGHDRPPEDEIDHQLDETWTDLEATELKVRAALSNLDTKPKARRS